MATDYIIRVKDLTKLYAKCTALSHVCMELEPNKIYGLLGRNGAGKTTLLNILASRVFPSAGQAYVCDALVYENIDILKQICLIEEKGFYSPTIKVQQALTLAGGLYPNWDQGYAQALLELFELDARKKYKQLSRGMESALGLIIGLASRAPLTMFDEPSLGLDAVMRERFYDAVIEDFSKYPRTIIISTHLIDEVSRLFEDVIIMDAGKVLLKTDANELSERAYYISGAAEDVKRASQGCILLGEERLGSTHILSVYSPQALISTAQVQVQHMPLQKLFMHLIDPSINENLKKGGVI